jgi:predicted DCC family thiol-disulfide oxidoreductase YuxK
MNVQGNHLVFFDGECGLCDQIVQVLLKKDKQKRFLFAPLKGETAENYLKGLPSTLQNGESLILIENYRSWNRRSYITSTAIFRICWLLGGWGFFPGLLYFFPSFLFNWAYRLLAHYRYSLLGQKCKIRPSNELDRFLP